MNPMHCDACDEDAVLDFTANGTEHWRCPECTRALWRPAPTARERLNRRLPLNPALIDPRLR